jgi:purine-binding chemotaxis protein CheW
MSFEAPAARSDLPAPDSAETTVALRFVIVVLGGLRFALNAEAVERIVRMAALVPLPHAPRHVAGMLNLQGRALLVVDPRRALRVALARPSAAQQLIVLRARSRYVLWVDGVEDMVIAAPTDLDALAATGRRGSSVRVLHHRGDMIPVISAAALDPRPRKARRAMPV